MLPNTYSLYIHIPWCVKKCPYCDFNSHVNAGKIDEPAYLKALLSDFEQEVGDLRGRQLTSIFIGGGTPSLLSPDFYLNLLANLRKLADFRDNLEITLEANPGTVDASNFEGYRNAGINRLSMGFQSLNDDKLRDLGRIHSAREALDAFYVSRSAGFDNINLDLMFALPGQTVGQALEDLQQVTELNPEHLSWYQLTLEPNTAFFAYPPANLPDDDHAWEIQQAGQQWLAQKQYTKYEISAYSRENRQCQHNLNYWRFGDYAGIGAGAHGKLTLKNQKVVRRTKKRNPADYLQGQYLSQQRELAPEDLMIEYLMNRLRLDEGFELTGLLGRTGVEAGQIEAGLELALSKKFLSKDGIVYTPTAYGHQFLNELLAIFV